MENGCELTPMQPQHIPEEIYTSFCFGESVCQVCECIHSKASSRLTLSKEEINKFLPSENTQVSSSLAKNVLEFERKLKMSYRTSWSLATSTQTAPTSPRRRWRTSGSAAIPISTGWLGTTWTPQLSSPMTTPMTGEVKKYKLTYLSSAAWSNNSKWSPNLFLHYF